MTDNRFFWYILAKKSWLRRFDILSKPARVEKWRILHCQKKEERFSKLDYCWECHSMLVIDWGLIRAQFQALLRVPSLTLLGICMKLSSHLLIMICWIGSEWRLGTAQSRWRLVGCSKQKSKGGSVKSTDIPNKINGSQEKIEGTRKARRKNKQKRSAWKINIEGA